jgi:N6-L-threonylcarbamoyladenine synthase
MPKFKRVLAIETSCDDTSVAVVDSDNRVISMEAANQDKDHSLYGGIVPEIASRNHTHTLLPLVNRVLGKANLTLSDVDGIAVTNRPGLIGALIVGLTSAKSLSMALNIPFIGVNHLEGHLLAPFLKDDSYAPPTDFNYPFLALAVSGGHTSLYLVHDLGKYEIIGRTKDDAAGEAFDKFAKILGFEFPGGIKIDQLSQTGDPNFVAFPRGMINDSSLDMSFSGMKSSGLRYVQSITEEEKNKNINSICASFQEAIVDTLVGKLDLAFKKYKVKNVILTGGVSANSRLRAKTQEWAKRRKLLLAIPPLRYCTDNAAMIGLAGIQRLNRGETSAMGIGPMPDYLKSDFVNEY